MKKKAGVLATSVASIAVCASLIVGSTYALFTSESQTNIAITSAKVDVTATISDIKAYHGSETKKDVWEYPETANGLLSGEEVKEVDGVLTLKNVAPGDKVTFNINVVNDSTVSVKYRTKITTTEDNGLMSGLVFNLGDKDYSGLVSYVSNWENWNEKGTQTIAATIELPYTAGNEYADLSCKIAYLVEAVQSNGYTEGTESLVKTKVANATEFVSSLNYVRAHGGEIELTEDITLPKLSRDCISITKNVAIDLNGHQLTTAKDAYFSVTSGGKLTISNGALDIEQSKSSYQVIDIAKGSSLEMNGVTMTTNGYAVFPHGDAARIDVVNCKFDTYASAIATNAGKVDNYDVVINVEDTEMKSETSCVLINVPCTAMFTDCNFKGKVQAAIIRGGNVTMANCALAKSQASEIDYSKYLTGQWSSGTGVPEATLVVGNRSTSYQYATNLTLINTTVEKFEDFDAVYMYGNATADIGATLSYDDTCVLGNINEAGGETKVIAIDVTIDSIEELLAFANEVNNGDNYAGKTVMLGTDIDLADLNWTPIGTKATPFCGTFDGNGYTISNLKIEDGDESVGFFGYVRNETGYVSALIKNFTLDGVELTGVAQMGAVAGELYTGRIDNVKVYNATIITGRRSGGITGRSFGAVTNCLVDGLEIKATPFMDGGVLDNGDKVGGIVGYAPGTRIVGNALKNAKLSAWRDLGSIAGYTNLDNGTHYVTDNSAENVELTYTLVEGVETVGGHPNENMGALIGRQDPITVAERNTAQNVTCIFVGSMNESYDLSVSNVIVKDVEAWTKSVTLSGTGTIIFENVNIHPEAEGASAVVLAENANVTMVINGVCEFKGAKGGNGITVPETANLDLSGDTLVVIGNNGFEYADDYYKNTNDTTYSGFSGSGIRIDGTAKIHNLANLTAEGYGSNAVGVGGATSLLEIDNTTIAHARGGMAFEKPADSDLGYGKKGEGAPAIGVTTGGTVKLTNVTVNAAEGGAKSAAIGGVWHQGVSVVIDGCTLKNIVGGHSAAAIGGGRIQANATYTVSVKINNSEISAQGGYYGAGIGTGYDTNCAGGTKNEIIITGASKIAAVGGKYAAGIGTGYHVGRLTGYIEASVDTTGTTANETKFYKDEYTTAQDIGYGVSAYDITKSNKEMGEHDITVDGQIVHLEKEVITFKVGDTLIADPRPESEW